MGLACSLGVPVHNHNGKRSERAEKILCLLLHDITEKKDFHHFNTADYNAISFSIYFTELKIADRYHHYSSRFQNETNKFKSMYDMKSRQAKQKEGTNMEISCYIIRIIKRPQSLYQPLR
jgi:hypothetical protein